MGRQNRLWLIGSLGALNELTQAVSLGRDGLARRQGTLTPSPVLSFDTIPDLVTCEPATIAWFYAGPPINMTLSITNQGVEQVTAPPVDSSTSTSTSTRPPLTNARRQVASSVDAVINTKINPESLTFRWTSVNFTSGTYQFRASIASQNFVSRSTSFNIRQGPDTSCLQSSSTATTTTGIPSNTAINAPVSTTSKSRNIGTIVGVVLGVLALFIVVILGYLRIRGKGKKRFGFSKDVARKWNGLSSVDSRNALAAHVNDEEPRLAAAKRRNYSRGSSVGTVVASHSKEVIGGGTSEEKVGSSNYSRKNSIASYDSSHVMALSTLPTLHHRDRDDVYNPRHHDPYPPASGAAVGRRTSVDRKSARSRSQPYLDPIESDNTVSRSSSVGGTSFTHTGPSDFYASSSPPHPSSPTPPLSAEAKRANRQSFGRKRKPVPAYDPNSEIPSVPSPTPQSPVPMDYEYGHDVRSSPSHQSHATTPDMITYSPAQTSTTLGHYTTRNAAAAAAEDGSETLGHKSSFGPAGVEGKPLHYLMPDLPMSEQTGSISSHSQR